ncbi:hypothetical protein HDU85_005662 [Gaertneriomyces sp. JEL0708]|nr:hypothetical protein HDU85_005662 [Gaertneriomyces sp. JEL0708]
MSETSSTISSSTESLSWASSTSETYELEVAEPQKQRKCQRSPLLSLPPEILTHLFQHLSPSALLTLSSASHYLYTLCSQPALWKRLCRLNGIRDLKYILPVSDCDPDDDTRSERGEVDWKRSWCEWRRRRRACGKARMEEENSSVNPTAWDEPVDGLGRARRLCEQCKFERESWGWCFGLAENIPQNVDISQTFTHRALPYITTPTSSLQHTLTTGCQLAAMFRSFVRNVNVNMNVLRNGNSNEGHPVMGLLDLGRARVVEMDLDLEGLVGGGFGA